MNCTTSDQLLLYAAGALESDERAAIDEHLEAGCEACRRRLGEAEEALAAVVMPADLIEPPAALKWRVMSQVEGSEPADPADPDLAHASLDAIAEGGGLEDRDAADRGARWRRLVAPAVAAMLAVVATLGAVQLTDGADRDDELELRELRRKVQEMERAEERLARLSGVMSDWGELVTTLASSAARIVPLKEVSGESEASGRFLLDPERSTGCLLISGLRPPGKGAHGAYRAWLMTKDNEPREVGSLHVDSRGRGWLVADLGADLSDVVKVNVGYRPADSEDGKPGTTLLAADFTPQQ